MRANDEVTKEHIDILESQLDAADIENDELKETIKEKDQVIKSLQVRLQYMAADPTVEV